MFSISQLTDNPDYQSSSDVKQKSRKSQTISEITGDVKDVRRELFGDDCHFCGTVPDNKRVVVHKKDGSKHSDELLWSKKKIKKLNPDEWVALCNKHHRYVHWAMDNLRFKWDQLAKAFERKRKNS